MVIPLYLRIQRHEILDAPLSFTANLMSVASRLEVSVCFVQHTNIIYSRKDSDNHIYLVCNNYV